MKDGKFVRKLSANAESDCAIIIIEKLIDDHVTIGDLWRKGDIVRMSKIT